MHVRSGLPSCKRGEIKDSSDEPLIVMFEQISRAWKSGEYSTDEVDAPTVARFR